MSKRSSTPFLKKSGIKPPKNDVYNELDMEKSGHQTANLTAANVTLNRIDDYLIDFDEPPKTLKSDGDTVIELGQHMPVLVGGAAASLTVFQLQKDQASSLDCLCNHQQHHQGTNVANLNVANLNVANVNAANLNAANLTAVNPATNICDVSNHNAVNMCPVNLGNHVVTQNFGSF
jgi:hypothetical protein